MGLINWLNQWGPWVLVNLGAWMIVVGLVMLIAGLKGP